jgi:hypothetical protein
MEDLLMAKQTGAEYREKNRIRLQRFYEKQAASGKKRISALISDGIHGHMMDEKTRTGMSISEIIESALNQRYGGQDVTQSRESETQEPAAVESADTGQGDEPGPDLDTPESDQGELVTDDTTGGDQAEAAALVDQESDTPIDEPEPSPQGDDLIPDCTGREITTDERDKILVQVAEAYPGRTKDVVQARVDLLNRKGIPVYVGSKQHPYGGEWTGKKFTDNLRFAKKRLGIK